VLRLPTMLCQMRPALGTLATNFTHIYATDIKLTALFSLLKWPMTTGCLSDSLERLWNRITVGL
uniref:Uncharacterized protein n=1 Tax=Spermophilus dauricus TaxID=99837 RepID=A0A8C9PWE6_SPEDA